MERFLDAGFVFLVAVLIACILTVLYQCARLFFDPTL